MFGLTEDAAALVLELMGFVAISKKCVTSIQLKGWDDLGAQFGVDQYVEYKQSTFFGKETWYIRLGTVPFEFRQPVGIWRKWQKKNGGVPLPSAIGNRRTTAFVTTELVSILKSSQMFHRIVNTRYFGNDYLDIDTRRIGTNARKIRAGLAAEFLVPDDSELNDEEEEEVQPIAMSTQPVQGESAQPVPSIIKPVSAIPPVWVAKDGAIADPSMYPLAHAFGIPTSNLQERKEAKKLVKTEKRVVATDSVQRQDVLEPVMKPRDTIKRGIKANIERKKQEEAKEE